jgi:hypothetical protein
MSTVVTVAAFVGILTVAIGYGTDVFEALVQRPALARVDDATVAAVMGRVHEYGDRRMPIPGTIGIVAAAMTTFSAAWSGSARSAEVAAVALGALAVWTTLYFRIAAPINKILTDAARTHTTPSNTRGLQARWDSIITARAVLMTVALAGLTLSLVLR